MFRVLPSALLLIACGYQPAASLRSGVEVNAITTSIPMPEVASCLTSELQLGLGAASRGVRDDYILEGELVDGTAEPGTFSRADGRIGSVDQETTLALRAQLIHRDRGVVWGPQVFRVRRRAPGASSAARLHAAARQANEWNCQELALRVVEDVTFFLSVEREQRETER